MMRNILKITLALAVLMLGGLPSLADDSGKGIEIHDAWMREAMVDHPAAAYVTIENKGDAPDRLLFITGPAVNHVDIHRSERSPEGLTQMTPLDSLDVPAGSTVRLEPGETHLMVYGFEQPLKRGTTLFLVLHFEHAGDVSAYFAVKAMDATGPGNENDDQHDNHGSGATKGA
jgi:periplasmic copper chaperone A